MEATEMTRAKLKEKSESEQIPFSSLLAGYLLEELMVQISTSEYGGYLWLKNPQILELNLRQNGDNELCLDFIYITEEKTAMSKDLQPGQKISLKLAYMMLLAFLKKEKTPQIEWKGNAVLKEEGVDFEIIGEFEEMAVPLRIRIREFSEEKNILPEKKTIRLALAEKELTYIEYPVELLLAEQIGKILKQREMISDMESYQCCYEILSRISLNGRYMRELVAEECSRLSVLPKESELEHLLSYQNDFYMENQWKSYLRYCGKTDPNWQETVDKIGKFLTPVWQAVCEDEVFLGDWMPELGRYLE